MPPSDGDEPTQLADDLNTARARARIGQVLRGKWRLEKLLGVGGMASVYQATHRNGKRGAVKMLHLELSLDHDARTRFLREGYVANKVDHPGAVSVLDDDAADDGAVFLVMELLEGETVEARACSRPGQRLEIGEVVALADRLLDVLAAAHDKGIVHRDLKPENLFLTTRGELKVLDFGIARLRELSTASSATRTGSLMGTPAFMPPEQALGNWSTVDARTDIWAVGATMFFLLTGRQVHEADTVNKLLLAAMTKPAPKIATLLPSIPPRLAAIVDCALAFEQHDRWPDARSMQHALRELSAPATLAVVGALPVHPPTLASPSAAGASPPLAMRSSAAAASVLTASPLSHPTLPGPTARSRPWGVVAGLAIAGVLGAGVVYTLTRDRAPVVVSDDAGGSAVVMSAPAAAAPAESAAPSPAASSPAPSATSTAPAADAAASASAPAAAGAGAKRPGAPSTAPRPVTPSARPKDPLDSF